jgi:acetoin utilization protein AcuC
MNETRFAFVHSSTLEKYHYPDSCPFKTERASLTKSILISHGLFTGDTRVEVAPVPLTLDELLLFHDQEYLEHLQRASAGLRSDSDLAAGLGTPDTPIFPDLFAYATLAGGGTVTAARLVLDKGYRAVFNPSGGYHHALASMAGGFCYINDVAIACRICADAGKKVCCIDLDVHHGNGTQAAFYGDPRVLTISLHESGKTLYPWSGFESEIGENAGRGYNVNVPLPAGTDDALYRAAFTEIVLPLLSAFSPEVVVMELGMDVLSADPLAHFRMTNNAFADLLPLVIGYGAPIVAVGGGGYNPFNTARGWALLWTVLSGIEPETDMAAGMDSILLRNNELGPGLRETRFYAQSGAQEQIALEAAATIEYLKQTVFPLHGI